MEKRTRKAAGNTAIDITVTIIIANRRINKTMDNRQ